MDSRIGYHTSCYKHLLTAVAKASESLFEPTNKRLTHAGTSDNKVAMNMGVFKIS